MAISSDDTVLPLSTPGGASVGLSDFMTGKSCIFILFQMPLIV